MLNNNPPVGTKVTLAVKNWYFSVTAWVAILQVFIGIATVLIAALQSGASQGSFTGVVVVLKGLFDLWQRFQTTEPIK